ncbi:MAG: gliding motility-associated C-terminal domain-containing protein [Bacteroidia bacterium]|nr:gliding motility-associated C-terminal domain-containing protein [Bacteroidia bacterium]
MKFIRLFIFIPTLLLSQKGKDGAGNITVANTIVNSYYVVTANASAGTNSVTVASNAGLAVGDLVMIIQMQGALLNAGKDSLFPDFNSSIPTNTTHGQINNYNNAGNYEIHQINQLPNNTTVVFDCPLTKNYLHLAKVQLVKIPRYTSLIVSSPGNIVPAAWNGSTGGVVAIEVAGNCTLNATPSIDATGRGFRGGLRLNFSLTGTASVFGGDKYGSLLYIQGGMKGESIGGDTTRYKVYSSMYGRGAMANGGGGGCAHNAGGGGGANAGLLSIYSGSGIPVSGYNAAWNLESPGFSSHVSSGGGRGGYSFSSNNQNPNTVGPNNGSWGGDQRRNMGGFGGRPLDYSIERLFLGGGGGAGHGNNAQASSGGNGGGIVFLIVDGNLSGSGTILSNGANAQNTTLGCSENDGAGGGGGGGCVVLKIGGSFSMSSATPVSVKGGNGGNVAFNCFIPNSQCYGPGAGGGGGFFGTNITTPITVDISGGANGVVTGNNNSIQQNFPPNGATQGGNGISTNTLSPMPVITTTNATVCVGSSASLTAQSGTNAIYWYNTLVGGTPIGNGTLFVTITFTSPGTYTYYAGSCPGIYRQPVTVSVIPAPTISVNSPTICPGQQATLTATGATSYTWSNSSNNQSIVVTPTSSSQYTVIGSVAGCISSAISTVIVSPVPTITVNSPTICSGNSATLIANGATNYTWNTSQTTSSIVVTPTALTVYTVIGASASGCTNVATATVSIFPTPTLALNNNVFNLCGNQSATIIAYSNYTNFLWSNSSTSSFIVVNSAGVYQVTVSSSCGSTVQSATVTTGASPTISIIPTSSLLCSGQQVTLTASNSGGTINWSTGTGGASIVINQSGIYTATITNACGTATAQVTINDGPSTSFNLISTSPTLCSGGQATLSATGSGSINWSNGSNNTPSIQINNPGVYTATLTNVCGTSVQQITISPGAAPDVSASASPTSICPNGTSTLTAFGNAPASYSWAGASGQHTLLVNSPGTYTAIAYNNCGVSMTTIQIIQQPAPSLTLIATPTVLCSGGQTTLMAIGVNGDNTFTWSNTNSNTSSINIVTAGTYTVTYGNICGSLSQSIQILQSNVNAAFSLNPTSGYPPLSVNFTNNSTSNSLNFWNFGNGSSSNLTNPPGQTYNTPGIYTVVLNVTDQYGCTSVASHTIEVLDIPFGIIPQLLTPDGDGKNDIFEIKGISKYPNNEIEIYNRWGNLVYHKKGYNNEWDGRPNTSSAMGKNLLPSGTYFYILKLNDNQNSIYKGFVHLVY